MEDHPPPSGCYIESRNSIREGFFLVLRILPPDDLTENPHISPGVLLSHAEHYVFPSLSECFAESGSLKKQMQKLSSTSASLLFFLFMAKLPLPLDILI